MMKTLQTEEIVLYNGGSEALPNILEKIENAKKSIRIGMFVWRDDRIGNLIADKLIEATNRGVSISIIKDKLGMIYELSEENKKSFFHKEFNLKLLVQAKAIDIFYPMKGKSRFSSQDKSLIYQQLVNSNYINVYKDDVISDHSKYYIFDDKTIIIGGMNIENKSFYTDVEGKEYIDFMIELNGSKYVESFYEKITYGKQNMKNIEFIINSKSNVNHYEIKNKIITLLSDAKISVIILMAYIGDSEITNKIIEIANKGINVTLLLPEKANIQHDLNMKTLKIIMNKTNNKVNAYLSKNMVHAKLIIIDNQIVTLGSANLNKHGMKRLSELNVLINNKKFNANTKKSINRNFVNTIRIINGSMIKFNPVKAIIEQII